MDGEECVCSSYPLVFFSFFGMQLFFFWFLIIVLDRILKLGRCLSTKSQDQEWQQREPNEPDIPTGAQRNRLWGRQWITGAARSGQCGRCGQCRSQPLLLTLLQRQWPRMDSRRRSAGRRGDRGRRKGASSRGRRRGRAVIHGLQSVSEFVSFLG